MEREQFKVLVKAMKAVYAQPTFIPDQDAFNVWFALLGDLPYKQAELAVQKHPVFGILQSGEVCPLRMRICSWISC